MISLLYCRPKEICVYIKIKIITKSIRDKSLLKYYFFQLLKMTFWYYSWPYGMYAIAFPTISLYR